MKNKLTLLLAAVVSSAGLLIVSPEASASYIDPQEHVAEAEKRPTGSLPLAAYATIRAAVGIETQKVDHAQRVKVERVKNAGARFS